MRESLRLTIGFVGNSRVACAGMCRHVPVRATVHTKRAQPDLRQLRESGALSDAEFCSRESPVGLLGRIFRTLVDEALV